MVRVGREQEANHRDLPTGTARGPTSRAPTSLRPGPLGDFSRGDLLLPLYSSAASRSRSRQPGAGAGGDADGSIELSSRWPHRHRHALSPCDWRQAGGRPTLLIKSNQADWAHFRSIDRKQRQKKKERKERSSFHHVYPPNPVWIRTGTECVCVYRHTRARTDVESDIHPISKKRFFLVRHTRSIVLQPKYYVPVLAPIRIYYVPLNAKQHLFCLLLPVLVAVAAPAAIMLQQ